MQIRKTLPLKAPPFLVRRLLSDNLRQPATQVPHPIGAAVRLRVLISTTHAIGRTNRQPMMGSQTGPRQF